MNSASSPLWGRCPGRSPFLWLRHTQPCLAKDEVPSALAEVKGTSKTQHGPNQAPHGPNQARCTRGPSARTPARKLHKSREEKCDGKAHGSERTALYRFLCVAGTWSLVWANTEWCTQWTSTGKCGPSGHGLLLFHYLHRMIGWFGLEGT